MAALKGRIGVADHGGWAVLVTLAPPGEVIDRCKVDLKAAGLPGLPHHDASRRLALADAVALVETVRLSARAHAPRVLEALAARLPCEIGAIALRALPTLPASVGERITNPWANARADGAMFREELAAAARSRGWTVRWIDKRGLDEAARTGEFLRVEAEAARRFAPPWNQDCRLALAAALATGVAGG